MGDSFDDISSFLLGDRDTDNDGVKNFNDCQPFCGSKADSQGWFGGKGLGSVGYDVDDSTSKRRKALKKMIRALQSQGLTKAESAMKVFEKLHGLYVTWSNQSGYQQSDITAVRRDRDWISNNYRMER